jgi:hypothetical protein
MGQFHHYFHLQDSSTIAMVLATTNGSSIGLDLAKNLVSKRNSWMVMSPFDLHVELLVSSVARIQEPTHVQISPLRKLHCLSYTILILI